MTDAVWGVLAGAVFALLAVAAYVAVCGRSRPVRDDDAAVDPVGLGPHVDLVRQVVIVHLKAERGAPGDSIEGIVERTTNQVIVLRHAKVLAPRGPHTPVAGEARIGRDRVDWIQVPQEATAPTLVVPDAVQAVGS